MEASCEARNIRCCFSDCDIPGGKERLLRNSGYLISGVDFFAASIFRPVRQIVIQTANHASRLIPGEIRAIEWDPFKRISSLFIHMP